MNPQDLIGTLAACLTTFSFIPQALKTFRTKDVSGISLSMYGCFTVGVALGVLVMVPRWWRSRRAARLASQELRAAADTPPPSPQAPHGL